VLETINSRALREHLSSILRLVMGGRGYTVTIQDIPVAILINVDEYRRLKRSAGENEE
jgi:antitoxin (DNA-binding transcriptional repressor) of toxin-antitoxin stability system